MGIKSKLKAFFYLDDDYLEEEEEYREPSVQLEPEKRARIQHNKNVISLQSVQKSAKLILIEPRTYADAQVIADHLINHRAVVVNVQQMDREQAKRVVDFLSGTVYAINGDIQIIGQEIILCVPENVEVSGTISDSFIKSDFDEIRW